MDEDERLAYSALGKTRPFRKLFDKAIEVIQSSYVQKGSHVAFSCGKDSSVVLHLVQQIDSQVPALFCSTEQKEYLDNYNEVLSQWKQLFNANITETMLTPFNWEPNKSIKEILNSPISDICYLGLRKSESKARRISLSKWGITHDYKKGGSRICPIANWTDQHVWAYIAYYKLPVLNFYKTVSKSSADSRTSVFLGTGHSGTSLAVKARGFAYANNHHFFQWEQDNPDIIRLMRCFYELKKNNYRGVDAIDYLAEIGYTIPSKRLEDFRLLSEKQLHCFKDAKKIYPYLSLAAWSLFTRIYEVETNESLADIVEQLRP